jgi:hypothetical protein
MPLSSHRQQQHQQREDKQELSLTALDMILLHGQGYPWHEIASQKAMVFYIRNSCSLILIFPAFVSPD